MSSLIQRPEIESRYCFFYLLSNFEHQRRIRAIVRVRVVRRVEAKSPHASPYTSEPEKSKGQSDNIKKSQTALTVRKVDPVFGLLFETLRQFDFLILSDVGFFRFRSVGSSMGAFCLHSPIHVYSNYCSNSSFFKQSTDSLVTITYCFHSKLSQVHKSFYSYLGEI